MKCMHAYTHTDVILVSYPKKEKKNSQLDMFIERVS